MLKKKRFLIIFSAIATISVLTGLLIGGSSAMAQTTTYTVPQNIRYTLYATDGWWMMADGTPIYSYGFVGGRVGERIYPLANNGGSFLNPAGIVVPEASPGADSATEVSLRGHAQFPAPLIYCAVGDTVTITLKNLGVGNPAMPGNPGAVPNAPNDPHTIHLHALDVDAANDGVPETSVATIPSNVDPAEWQGAENGAGNVVVYSFKANLAGTYFYHCHQEADIHVTMGMYGALIVYNRTDAGATKGPGYAGTLHNFRYAKDVVMLLSDTDVRQHLAETGTITSVNTPNGPITTETDNTGAPFFNPVDYKPQYWFINGLSFPNTVHAGLNWNNWIKAHPGYDPLITGSVSQKQKVLVRMINLGFETQPMHSHGFHPKVLGSDQRTWYWANNPLVPTGKGLEKNTVTIGSGEEYDLLFDFSTVAVTSTYNTRTQTRYNGNGDPVSNTVTPSPTITSPEGEVYIAGPKVKGVGAIVPPDATVPGFAMGQDVATSQIFVYHNHDDYKATNNGLYPGGMFTVIVPLP